MVILDFLSFSLGNVSSLRAWVALVQSDGSNSTLSPVVHRDIVQSINMLYTRGATVPEFLVRDSANAKLSRFRDTEKV